MQDKEKYLHIKDSRLDFQTGWQGCSLKHRQVNKASRGFEQKWKYVEQSLEFIEYISIMSIVQKKGIIHV